MADYTKTLNLPYTDFAMRASLPTREPQTYEYWKGIDIYSKIMSRNENKPSFILHDGPPYANGNIHVGHALNKTLKDFVIKSKNMSGFKAPLIHGWDTHGLPIENQMLKKHKIKRHEIPDFDFRELCRQFALDNVENQKKQMQRLGVIGDWDNSYMTIIPKFEEEQIRIFGKMAQKGYIYKGLKPVYWCPKDETALAEAEIEYANDVCDSLYVKFQVVDDKNLFGQYVDDIKNVYFVIWTTTTWTLPANLAICLNGEYEYSLVKVGNEYYIFATELVETVAKVAGIQSYETVAKFKGADLENMTAQHPFFDRISYIINGDHVTLESGTGCVHTAPGHGMDDFLVCKKYPQIDIVVPVDAKGRMNALAGKYEGLTTDEANKAILADLTESGALLAVQRCEHQYPHCWRCKSPILFRATEQWFCSVDGFKEEALKAIKGVNWIPSWGEVRIENMVRERNDWCISRQRIWGVPIPLFYCEECGEPLINEETIEKVATLFGKEGSNAWYKYTAKEILGEAAKCSKCGHTEFKKETDIMDVWFDSGSSYAYVLGEENFPADLYLEGNDQYRGWFQSSLLTSVATRGVAPYKTVITHGFFVDGEGRKVSKSLGNGIEPEEIISEYGADVLRLWVSSVEYTNDVRISRDILKQLSEIYRKIRNTARILLANLGKADTDFNPETDMLDVNELYDIDKWALSRLQELIKKVRAAYDNYSFHLIYHDIHNFCSIDLSKLYIDITKDRLYVEKKNSKERRSAQTAMYLILSSLTRLLAPILAYTSEEIWQNMSHLSTDNTESVLLNDLPAFNENHYFAEILEHYNKLFDLRDDVLKALEIARANKVIGKSLDAKITIYAKDEAYKLFSEFKNELPAIFIASQVNLENTDAPANAFSETESGIAVVVEVADGHKCDRCWTYSTECEEADGGYICPRCKEIIRE